ncbi:MAG TPA: DVU3141 family protein, partial [Arenibaculum sp.]|nr:DVU3141 family protein [Arenibaculum sp.]
MTASIRRSMRLLAVMLPLGACATLQQMPDAPALPATASSPGAVLGNDWAAFLSTAPDGAVQRLAGPGGEPVTVAAGARYAAASGRECRRYGIVSPGASGPGPQRIA